MCRRGYSEHATDVWRRLLAPPGNPTHREILPITLCQPEGPSRAPQMIFGVEDRGVCVTNGIEVMSYKEMMKGLVSPSELLIERHDALNCQPYDAADADALGKRWAGLQVTKQLQALKKDGAKHITIPAAYKARRERGRGWGGDVGGPFT